MLVMMVEMDIKDLVLPQEEEVEVLEEMELHHLEQVQLVVMVV
tara:strand:- start:248 stop:376 length:129 start_codon:yes stop_codon:yes gene_type:complete